MCEVIGQDGEKYETTYILKEVYDYFNSNVPYIKNRTIINATEGGLGIKGADVSTLQETAEKYFTEKVEMPSLRQDDVIDRAKILAKVISIKRDLEQLVRFTDLFRIYIDNLYLWNIDFEYIKTEIDQWFDNLRDKSAYQYISILADWFWYQLVTSETPEGQRNGLKGKRNAINLFEDLLKHVLGLINQQIQEV
jgi:hypothetical protein